MIKLHTLKRGIIRDTVKLNDDLLNFAKEDKNIIQIFRSYIMNNGTSTGYFTLERGTRQSDYNTAKY